MRATGGGKPRNPSGARPRVSGCIVGARSGNEHFVQSRRALVTWGTSLIGRAITAVLRDLGYGVQVWGRDRDALAAAAESPRVTGRVVDLADPAAVDAALDALLRQPVHVVVHAAGVFDWARADEADPQGWQRLLEVNLVAAARITARVAPALVAHAPSAVIFLGSTAARQAFANNAAYVASKRGIAGLAEATFLDLRDAGVNVSLISPGLVAAGAGLRAGADPDRLLQPDDVAAAVRFVLTFPDRGCPTEIRLQPQKG